MDKLFMILRDGHDEPIVVTNEFGGPWTEMDEKDNEYDLGLRSLAEACPEHIVFEIPLGLAFPGLGL